MSKCLICGNELVTGDTHWEQGMCNMCWNKTFNKDVRVPGIDLINIYKDKILILEQQLAEKDKEIEILNDRLDKYISGRLKSMIAEKDAKINKLLEEHFEMFGDMKDYKNLWLAEQRKNKEIRKQVCDEIRQAFNKEDFWLYEDNNKIISIHEDKFNEILDQIKKGEKK